MEGEVFLWDLLNQEGLLMGEKVWGKECKQLPWLRLCWGGRQIDDGQGEGMERGKEGESVLQAGSSADHTRTKESLSFHGAPSWPGLWRSLSGLPLGLSGAIRLLHLLVPPRYSNCYEAFCSASSAKSPTQQRQLLLAKCVGSGGFEARSSREKFLSGDQCSLWGLGGAWGTTRGH